MENLAQVMQKDDESQVASMYRQACEMMKKEMSDEKQPYKEKYDARGYLDICLAMSQGTSPSVKLAKALC